MTVSRLSAREREDDARKGYDFWVAWSREVCVRSKQVSPRPGHADEMRWAAEGPRPNNQLDCARRK